MLSLYNKHKLIGSVTQNYKLNAKVPMGYSSNALGKWLGSAQFYETLGSAIFNDCVIFWTVTGITSISTIITNWTLTIPSCSILMGTGAIYLRHIYSYKLNNRYKFKYADELLAIIVSFVIFNCFVFWLLTLSPKKTDDNKN